MTTPLSASQPLLQEATAALARGDAPRARDLLSQAISTGQADASVWLAMARTREVLGDLAGKGEAIDRALAAGPNDLRALLAKADHLAAGGDERAASTFYGAALQYMPRYSALPPPLQEGLRRADAVTKKLARELEDFVRATLDATGARIEDAPPRFQTAVDIMFGKKRIYLQEPRYLYYPGLPQIEFFDREAFPWFDAVEAATADVREELARAIGPDFRPYVERRADRPGQRAGGMAGNADWSAYFLRKDGHDQPGAAACPRTMAALADAPLTTIPNRAPSILFSKLAAGAKIPPHHGKLNARLICHLPLIVPEGCEFRVGNEVRHWREGKAWAFDDTMEHEAWNKSRVDRYILIFDVWRPELSADECTGIAALCEAIDAYRGSGAAWDV